MVAFFIFATASIAYYGIILALRPLQNLRQNVRNASGASVPIDQSDGIASIVNGLEDSLGLLKEKLHKIETDNMELASKLGVVAFEKNQIVNIVDSINFGIIITDIQGNITHTNDYMLNLLAKKYADVVDHPLFEVLEHNEIISFLSQQETLKQNTTMGHIETTFPELAPKEVFQVSSSYLKDSEGGIIGNVISIKNITREKFVEKTKHEFIAHVAHELMTPLTTIKSYNEMLMDGEIDDSEMQKEFYNTINDETTRLTQVIKDLINISKIELGGLTLDKELVKTDGLVEDCFSAIEASALKKRLAIEKNLPDRLPSLVGDKELLKIAIINILNNAVKYSPENRKITFSLNDQDNTIIFDVIDTGYGISKEDLPHIFDRSYRSSAPHIAEQNGSGLGLAITSEIIRLHGGEIEVESELGKGTHFTISIPKEEYYLAKQ